LTPTKYQFFKKEFFMKKHTAIALFIILSLTQHTIFGIGKVTLCNIELNCWKTILEFMTLPELFTLNLINKHHNKIITMYIYEEIKWDSIHTAKTKDISLWRKIVLFFSKKNHHSPHFSGLLEHLKKNNHEIVIDLNNEKIITEKMIGKLKKHSCHIVGLHFNKDFEHEILEKLCIYIPKFPKLKELSISYCNKFADNLREMFSLCESLQKLCINLSKIKNNNILTILNIIPSQLKKFTLVITNHFHYNLTDIIWECPNQTSRLQKIMTITWCYLFPIRINNMHTQYLKEKIFLYYKENLFSQFFSSTEKQLPIKLITHASIYMRTMDQFVHNNTLPILMIHIKSKMKLSRETWEIIEEPKIIYQEKL